MITDAFTKYMELLVIPDKTAKTVVRTIMDSWVCRFSTLKEIVTGGGKEFANELLNSLCAELQIIHKSTTPYHPQTNGAVEVLQQDNEALPSHSDHTAVHELGTVASGVALM